MGITKSLPYAKVPAGFCAYTWTTGLSSPRAILTVENGDVIVLESGANKVTVMWNDTGNREMGSARRKHIGNTFHLLTLSSHFHLSSLISLILR
jgi:hypothetical protein